MQHRSLKYQHGFTFVEILTVVFIAGLVVTLIVVNAQRDADGVVLLEAKRFSALVNAALDESVLTGIPLGIGISGEDKSYRFFRFIRGWKKYEEDIFKVRAMPETVGIKTVDSTDPNNSDLRQQTEDSKKEEKPPHIIITPDGLISSFVVEISTNTKKIHIKPGLDQTILISEVGE